MAVAEQRASVVHKTLLFPLLRCCRAAVGFFLLFQPASRLPPSLFSVGAVAGRLNALESELERERERERERRTASETANGHSSAASRFTSSFKLEGTFTEQHCTALREGVSQAERVGEDNSNAASLRSADGRSVGRGGDRYDMHAASEEEEDSASAQSDKEAREGPIEGGKEGGRALSVGPQPRI